MEQINNWFITGIVKEDNDCLDSDQNPEEFQKMKNWITEIALGDEEAIHKKYLTMSWRFKTLKAAFHTADGSLTKMLMNFPILLLFNTKMQIELNTFLCNPASDVLSRTWNLPSVSFNLIFRQT